MKHVARDAGDAREAAGEEGIETRGQGGQGASGREQVELESGGHLEVLNMQPGGCTGDGGDEQRDGGGEEGGFDGEDNLRSPKDLTQHDREAAESEGEEMQQAGAAAGVSRHPEWRSVDCGRGWLRTVSRPLFGSIEAATVVVVNTPARVVGRSGDNADLMAATSKPDRHFAGVLADAGEFGRVVETVHE